MKNRMIIVGCIVVLVSCLSPYNGDQNENGLPDTETPMVISDLFIPVESGDANTTMFYTNNPAYRTPSGYTLWAYTSDSVDLQERTVSLKKQSGSSIAGYGIIICSAPRQVGSKTENVFLTVMINNNKQYAIGKVTGASYKSLVYWTNSTGLEKAPGMENVVSVKRDSANKNKFSLYCNDVFEQYFTDEELPACEGTGRNGYIVVIAPDDLDKSAVEVWFYE
jgi:hypothetical protein